MIDEGINDGNSFTGSDGSSTVLVEDVNEASGDVSTNDSSIEEAAGGDFQEELSVDELLAEQPASTAESATAVDAAAIYEPICYKLDLIVMLLIVFFAAYMFKGLANPYKLGGKHIGKSS